MLLRGFTLIELIIYIFIVGLVMSTMGIFVTNLLQVRGKTAASSDVIIAASTIQDQLARAGRHAEGINIVASIFGSDPGILSLDMVDASIDPTVFSLNANDGQFQMSEAGAPAVLLTSDDVRISNLVFTNLTGSQDAGIIQVQFTIESANESGSPYFNYEQSFQTTLRLPIN